MVSILRILYFIHLITTMNYKKHRNDRIFRRNILKFFSKIHIKSTNFWFSQVLLLISMLLLLTSLFIPWFSLPLNNETYWIFSKIFGISWYIITIILIINAFFYFHIIINKSFASFLETLFENLLVSCFLDFLYSHLRLMLFLA
jgi:hypothetical protein